jgi:hypothetical protein
MKLHTSVMGSACVLTVALIFAYVILHYPSSSSSTVTNTNLTTNASPETRAYIDQWYNTQTVPTSLITQGTVNESQLNQRFAGLLSHVRWLMDTSQADSTPSTNSTPLRRL